MSLANVPWSQMPRVLSATNDNPDVCSLWRVWWPALEMNTHGYVSDYCKFGDLYRFEVPLRFGRYNTIVTPRMTFPYVSAEKEWFALLDSLGPRPKWWYDLDDDLVSPVIIDRLMSIQPASNPADLRQELEVQRESRLSLIRQADGVTVASPTLAQVVSNYTAAPIKVVTNGINPHTYLMLEQQPPERQFPPLTVGWSGGPRLEADLEPLPEVWRKLAQLRPNVHFVVQGWLPGNLLAAVPANRLHTIGGVKNDDYPATLRNIDIFCAVAGDDEWALSKTPIKWFEATLAGAACVVSRSLYGPVIEPPFAALVADTPDEWLRSLLALVDDTQLRTTIQTAARQSVLSKHTVQKTYSAWTEAWITLL